MQEKQVDVFCNRQEKNDVLVKTGVVIDKIKVPFMMKRR
jgi:hypothetical protein